MLTKSSIFILLAALFIWLQYLLWFGDGAVVQVYQSQKNHELQQIKNKTLQERNANLISEIKDLRTGHDAVEESARRELGMIKEKELFYQVISEKKSHEKH